MPDAYGDGRERDLLFFTLLVLEEGALTTMTTHELCAWCWAKILMLRRLMQLLFLRDGGSFVCALFSWGRGLGSEKRALRLPG